MKQTINGFEMAYIDKGTGIPLLFVHGFPLNKSMWSPQIEHLSQSFRVIAPDLRGHGDSESLPGPYPMELLADDLNALLNYLEIKEPVILCGLSMGGYILFAFYRKYHRRLAGLIFTSTRAGADSPEAQQTREQTAARVLKEGITPVVDGMFPKLLAPNNYHVMPELAEEVKTILNSTSVEGVAGALQGMKVRLDSTPILPEINLPTLIIHGKQDQIIPVSEAEKMASVIPSAGLKILSDSGHLPNLEQPDDFNLTLRGFLGRL